MEYYPFIKKVIKNIIRKVFFICEPFITVTNNTNSYFTRGSENASTKARWDLVISVFCTFYIFLLFIIFYFNNYFIYLFFCFLIA